MQLTVEQLETLVWAVIITCCTASLVALTVGAWGVLRYRGEHRSHLRAADIGHQPTHAKAVAPSRLAVLAAEALASVREIAAAHAALRGDTTPTVLIGGSR